MEQNNTSSFIIRSVYVLIGLIALTHIVIVGKEILCPLLFSFLFAVLLLPVANFIERRLHFHHALASFTSVLLLVICIALIVFLVGSQVSELMSEWPQFKAQVLETFATLQKWISIRFKVNSSKQMDYVHSTAEKIMSSGTEVFGATVLSVSSVLFFLVFTFIYTFFFLLYRQLIIRFLVALFREENSKIVYDIVEQIQFMIRRYVIGLITEMAIIAVVVCTAFLILGIKYAILLGLITGLFNIIPYVGIFTALLLSVLITFATAGAITKVILVVIVIIAMHLIDSNILLPLIVGSKVKINAFLTILGVVAGEMIWGIPGMFLSIPILAVLKIIFDKIEGLQPWGILLGEDERIKKGMDKRKDELEGHKH